MVGLARWQRGIKPYKRAVTVARSATTRTKEAISLSKSGSRSVALTWMAGRLRPSRTSGVSPVGLNGSTIQKMVSAATGAFGFPSSGSYASKSPALTLPHYQRPQKTGSTAPSECRSNRREPTRPADAMSLVAQSCPPATPCTEGKIITVKVKKTVRKHQAVLAQLPDKFKETCQK